MKYGKMNGQGKYVWKDGTIYEGDIVRNELTGHGTFLWPDGSSYLGEVKAGLRDGKGVYLNNKGGYKYEGEWKEGLRDGEGTLTYLPEEPFMSYYKGKWKRGFKSGYGEYLYRTGNLYKGEWADNKKNGAGTMYWTTLAGKRINEKYTGHWEDDKQNGFGAHIWLDSRGENRVLRNRYVGYWKNGIRDGHGMFFYANGSMYIGEWKDNMKHGAGKFIYENGEEYDGEFARDRMVDRPINGVIKTMVPVVEVPVDAGKGLGDTKRAQKAGKGEERVKPGEMQAKYYVTERVRSELEGNPYDPMLDISDLLSLEQLEVISQPMYIPDRTNKLASLHDEVNKIMLIHNSELKSWYKFYSREVDCPEIEEGFMMVSMQFWRFLRDCKVFSPVFSLAQYNRLYLRGKGANFSLKYDPLTAPEPAEADWIQDAKNNGQDSPEILVNENEYVAGHVAGMRESVENSKITNILPASRGTQSQELSEDEFEVQDDVHDSLRPMLFRHFAEAIIRATAVCYQNADESIKVKLINFFKDKLISNLNEVINNDKPTKPSLSFQYNRIFMQHPLFPQFKLHSQQFEHGSDKNMDYTILAQTFIEMAAKTLAAVGLEKIDLIAIIEKDYELAEKADTILQDPELGEDAKAVKYEEHVKGILSKELTFYEFKELIAELALCGAKEGEAEEDAVERFVAQWEKMHGSREIRRKMVPARKWIPTEKELM